MTVRLGYACINLSLQTDKESPRLKGLTAKRLSAMEPAERRKHLYQVARNNLKTVEEHLRWNVTKSIRLYRITSELIPLATHPVAAEWNWAEDLGHEFSILGNVVRETGARVTMHPGQYTVLNAKEKAVVEKAVEDLAYHARILDLLETGPESGLVLHIGGAYGDKAAAAERFIRHFGELPEAVARRLWVENDDTTWDTEEVLAIACAIGRPMVLDIHHHRVLREDDWRPWLDQVLPTWGEVRPKLHFSSPKEGPGDRSHADGIDAADFGEVLRRLEGLELDMMLECKEKDVALLRLARELGTMGLGGRIEPRR